VYGAIGVTLPPNRAGEPVGARNPAIRYGLGNLIENAVDFARSRVEIFVQWDDDEATMTISAIASRRLRLRPLFWPVRAIIPSKRSV